MLIPVILSGGAGTRLWPVSRKAHPKPFMRLADGQTLAGATLRRALGAVDHDNVLTVTARDYYFFTRDIYREVAPEASHRFVLEPEGRNTAAAIGAAAMWVRDHFGEQARMLVMPADHLVRDTDAFNRAVRRADALAAEGWLVCLGVQPTHAETGFGYIRAGESLAHDGARIEAFVEKPDAETAQRYFESREYLWNAGMFCFTARGILDALAEQAPDILAGVEATWGETGVEADPVELDASRFAAVRSESVDFAVMEKAPRRAVVPVACGWSDIGSWQAISDLYETDGSGNQVQGHAVIVDTKNTFVQSDQRLVAAVGVDDLVIVDTADAVLVARRGRDQEVKSVVEELTRREHDSAVFHQTVHRPWGRYTVLEDAADCKVKRLVVRPGGVLSLQRHEHRSEHWTVVSGTARVQVDDERFELGASQTVQIPAGSLHRLENPGHDNVHIIEVQTGSYFGEDDIERLEDVYGRV
ncbi:MAG: mannose-1-phosphate guanylyltransferase/mannose-6-phosphate isomerase [Wenzhouxiangellaceae bacterium]|nr:mannose-1-phosphate guanylyltransferase/mannose-6-phosphate isomerase [Wenzhouxiangellaceae bacterium]